MSSDLNTSFNGFCVWLTGWSGAGKTTLATALRERLGGVLIDGDDFRKRYDVGPTPFSREARDRNVLLAAKEAGHHAERGERVFVALISPYAATRIEAYRRIGRVQPVYVQCSPATLIARDPKGLYQRALAGELERFTGISDPYEAPGEGESALVVDTDRRSVEACVEQILGRLEANGWLKTGQKSPRDSLC